MTRAFACAWLAAAGVAAQAAGQTFATISHSLDPDTITPGNSVACQNPDVGATRENRYYRSFNLDAFSDIAGFKFKVTGVRFGVEEASSAGGTGQSITVSVYRDKNGGAPLLADLVLLGSAVKSVPDGSLFFVDVPVLAQFEPHETMVVEVKSPDGLASGNWFIIGSNPLGQTAPSYLWASVCGISQITDLAGVGWPDMHVVLSVTGEKIPPCEADCNDDGVVNIFDFLCFQGQMTTGGEGADCNKDGQVNIFDFLCFQGLVTLGCL
jgi:hypothetical protein